MSHENHDEGRKQSERKRKGEALRRIHHMRQLISPPMLRLLSIGVRGSFVGLVLPSCRNQSKSLTYEILSRDFGQTHK